MQTYILLCYITYSNDECCYDSSNYIKDLDLEVCVCVCVCVRECLPGLCVHVCMWYKNSLAEPDPYAGGRGSGDLLYTELFRRPVQGGTNQIAASLRYHSHAPLQYHALSLNIARPLK